MRAVFVAAVAAAFLIGFPVTQVEATPMTSGGRKFGANHELSYVIDGTNVDIEVAYRGRAGYFAVLFTTLNGIGHTTAADSVICSTGNEQAPAVAVNAIQGNGGKAHIMQNPNTAVLKSAGASNILSKCRFTRPLSGADDKTLGAGALDVVLVSGNPQVKINPGSQRLTYDTHLTGEGNINRVNFDFADGQGGTPGQGAAVLPDPVGGGDGGPPDLITEPPAPTIDLEGKPEDGIPMEIMIAGGAGGLVALAGLYTVVRRSGAGAPRRRSKQRSKGFSGGPPPTQPKPGAIGSSATPMGMGMGMGGGGGGGGSSNPSPWRAAMDPSTNRVYYFHKYTQETMWTKPPGFAL
jgi:hypothetical protein